jgi:hypothetical protein
MVGWVEERNPMTSKEITSELTLQAKFGQRLIYEVKPFPNKKSISVGID